MNCEQFLLKMDAYIDGELSNEELNEMRKHAENCEACRIEMEKADFLRETLNGIDDDIVVPLEAQAAWRKAVRAEAKQKSMRKWSRGLAVVAAALVLALGCTAVLNSDMFAGKNINAVEMDAANSRSALVYTDGADEISAPAYVEYSAKMTYAVNDIAKARGGIDELLGEYDAELNVISKEGIDADQFFYVKLPADNLEDFLSALNVIGEEKYSEFAETEGEIARVSIRLVLN